MFCLHQRWDAYTFRVSRLSVSDTETDWEFSIANLTAETNVTLGTITTSNIYNAIVKESLYQFSEYFGPGAPAVTCDTVPLSVATWTYPELNGTPLSSTYRAWTPPPLHCGPFKITPNEATRSVEMRYGRSVEHNKNSASILVYFAQLGWRQDWVVRLANQPAQVVQRPHHHLRRTGHVSLVNDATK